MEGCCTLIEEEVPILLCADSVSAAVGHLLFLCFSNYNLDALLLFYYSGAKSSISVAVSFLKRKKVDKKCISPAAAAAFQVEYTGVSLRAFGSKIISDTSKGGLYKSMEA